YVALAAIVDNTTPENSGSEIQSDGYYESPAYDDGDRMIESVDKSGTSLVWEANICSKNISDGPVELVYVVFDNAGNCVSDSVSGTVCNYRPRLAGFTLATDYNGDFTMDETLTDYNAASISADYVTGTTTVNSETVNVYDPDANSVTLSKIYPLPTSMTAGDEDNPVMKVRGYTTLTPEIVGGNGALYYSYSVTNGSNSISGQNATAIVDSAATDYTINDSDAINIQTGDLIAIGNNSDGIPFEFKFWDSAEGTEVFTNETLCASLTVYIAVNASSTDTPLVEIKPFYWNSLTDNSVYDSSSASSYAALKGHIELEADWLNSDGYDSNTSGTQYDVDPKVSGAINIEGSAHDDNLIASIAVTINGTSYTVASFDDDAAALVTAAAKADYGTNGYWFEITEQEFSASGHDVEWTFHWNTESYGTGIDVPVTVIATNYGTPSASTTGGSLVSIDGTTLYAEDLSYSTPLSNTPVSTSTASDALTDYYCMDIVPYVTKLTTSLSDYNTVASIYNRTALGHYPVYMSFAGGTTAAKTATNYAAAEYESVTVTGFNLSDGTMTFKGDSDNTADLTASGSTDSDSGAAEYTFTIPAGAQSGQAYVVVGSISSLNNSNNNDSRGAYGYETDDEGNVSDTVGVVDLAGNYSTYSNYYNRIPNKKNNNILTDDLYFDIWDINSGAAIPESGKADNLEMKINPATGMIGFAFTNGSSRFNMAAADTSYTQWNRAYDVMKYNAFAYDTNGYTYGSSVGGDINNSSTYGDKYSFMTSRWDVVGNAESSNATTTASRHIENIGQSNAGYINNTDVPVDVSGASNVTKSRIKSPCIAAHYNDDGSTDVYLAYFDSLNGELRFRLGNINGTVGNYGSIRTDGSSLTTYTTSANYVQVVAASSDSSSSVYNLNDNSDEDNRLYAEDYVNIAVTSNNVLVMVWYSGSDLYYSYFDAFKDGSIDNETVLSTYIASKACGRNGWSEAVCLKEGAGVNCQIVTGNDNSVHIAAYDGTSSDLYYVYMSSYDGTPVEATVDSYLDVGEHLTIDVAEDGDGNQIPYIGYWGSYPEKPRYAYLADPETFYAGTETDGTDGNYYTGVWECTIVPTQSTVKDSRKINVGVWKYATDEEDGVLAYSTTGTNYGLSTGTTSYTSSYADTSEGICYGNGSNNGVMAYVVAPSSSEYNIETAQMRQKVE
uniref:hypothetical protein n=1 Tax=Treponema sp. TaxID=166 RepID=UPI0025E28E92